MRSFWILLALISGLGVCQVQAHQLGVDSVFLEEKADFQYKLSFNISPGSAEALTMPILPPHCQWSEESESAPSGSMGLKFSSVGRALSAEDKILLPWKRNGVLFTALWHDGTKARQFFISNDEGILVDLSQLKAGSGSLSNTAKRFTRLGIEHIWKGLDHLLFVAGLLLLVKGARRLTLTITAFTVAHSTTLALSVFGQVQLEQGLVDVLVAMSIVFLAVEIVYAHRGHSGWSMRWPWLVSFGFGLIHGLGFAGALNALGLPADEVPPALLFFNLGVEIGQLLFVALWLVVIWAGRQLSLRLPKKASLVPAYALGIIASCWFIDRVLTMFAV